LPLVGGQIPLKVAANDKDRLVLKAKKLVAAFIEGPQGGVECRKEKRLAVADNVGVKWQIEGPPGKAGRFSTGHTANEGESVIYTPPELDPGEVVKNTIRIKVDDSATKGDDPPNKGYIELLIKRPAEPDERYLLVDTVHVEPFASAARPSDKPEPECDCEIETEWKKAADIEGGIVHPFLCATRLQRLVSTGRDADDLQIDVTHPVCEDDKAKIKSIDDVTLHTWEAKLGTFLGGAEGRFVIYKPPEVLPDSDPIEKIKLKLDDIVGQYNDHDKVDEEIVTAYKVDLTLFKPDGKEVPEDEEEEPVGYVWLNRDNDDNDDVYDTADKDLDVHPQDDELVKIRLEATPPVDNKHVRLRPAEGETKIKLWTDPHKGTKVDLPATFSFKDLPKTLYLEGVDGSAAQGDVGLVLECVGDELCRDEVRLTVLDIEKLVWEGMGNSVNDDDNLDANNHPSGTVGLRVFPGARGLGPARDVVKVKVVLNVAPPEEVDVYLRAFDVDDPSANTGPLDDPGTGWGQAETWSSDNRGGVNGQPFGQFVKSAVDKTSDEDNEHIKTLTFNEGEKEKEAYFRVTKQPGDNFRIAASNDRDLLLKLRNKDDEDGVDITNKVTPASAGVYDRVSPVLTVWRKLHIEVDSMGPVTGNEVQGKITGLNPPSSATAKQVTVDNDLDDGSPNLDSAPLAANGRFEGGTLTVAQATITVDGNGAYRIVQNNGLNITPLPFMAKDNDWFGNSTISGSVTRITLSGDIWVLGLSITARSETPIDWPDFVKGTISIGGGPEMEIVEIYHHTVPRAVGVSDLKIPYSLVDDDNLTGDVPSPDVSYLATAFAPAYVLPVYDVGDNNSNVPFVLNVNATDKNVYDFDADSYEANPDFWTVYLLGAYQPNKAIYLSGGRILGDGDPNSEGRILGAVDSINGVGAKIFKEVLMHDVSQNISSKEPLVTAHEVGHLFNGLHRDCPQPVNGFCDGSNTARDAGIMAPRANLIKDRFTPITLNKIRSIRHP
jgi:hypothetical protein